MKQEIFNLFTHVAVVALWQQKARMGFYWLDLTDQRFSRGDFSKCLSCPNTAQIGNTCSGSVWIENRWTKDILDVHLGRQRQATDHFISFAFYLVHFAIHWFSILPLTYSHPERALRDDCLLFEYHIIPNVFAQQMSLPGSDRTYFVLLATTLC